MNEASNTLGFEQRVRDRAYALWESEGRAARPPRRTLAQERGGDARRTRLSRAHEADVPQKERAQRRGGETLTTKSAITLLQPRDGFSASNRSDRRSRAARLPPKI